MQSFDGRKIQYGCFFDRDVHFEKTTGESEEEIYFILDGLCNLCRNDDWLQKCQGSIMRKLYNESRAKIDVLFINRSNQQEEIEHCIKKNIELLDQNKNKPVTVNFTSFVPIDYHWYIKTVEKYSKNNFRVVRPYSLETDHQLLDMCVQKFKANYYLVFDLHTNFLLDKILDRINVEINEKLTKLLVIYPTNDFDGLLMSRLLHTIITKEYGLNILEHLPKLENIDKMRKTWTDLLL
jgi:hypothetical protein